MTERNNCIKNGAPWYDVDGKRIHVQFPHIIYHNDTYYLYGSNKEFSNGTGIWHYGVKMYESKDFYNWKEVGTIIPPDENDPDSPLNPHNMLDAPCIVYNRKTDKWVCWMNDLAHRTAYTLVSDSLFGPYEYAGKAMLPCGLTIGDFDVAQTEDGKAYIYFNNPHERIICAELTEDYTAATGKYTVLLERPEGVPFVREAPASFCHNGKNYVITSGTTAFFPNPSEIAVADSYLGEYETIGDPHVGDASRTSFHSQIRSVFKVPGKKDLYITLADRWLTQYMDLPYEVVERWYKIWHHENTPEELEQVKKEGEEYNVIQNERYQDVSQAEYVVLPIVFENGNPVIYWRDSWSLEEFE